MPYHLWVLGVGFTVHARLGGFICTVDLFVDKRFWRMVSFSAHVVDCVVTLSPLFVRMGFKGEGVDPV